MKHYGLEWHSLDTYLQFKESSTPGTPEPNEIRQYASDSAGISTMCWKNDAGGVICLPTIAGTVVAGSGVNGQVAFWTGASILSGENALFWDATNDRLGIGTATPDFRLTLLGDASNAANTNIVFRDRSATASGPGMSLLKARGTAASPAATNSGDTLGAIGFGGWTDADKHNAARIDAFAGSLWTATNSHSHLAFSTTPSGSLTRAEGMRLDGNGDLMVGATTHPFSVVAGRGILAARNSNAEIGVASAGTGLLSVFRGMRARNTLASPQAIQADDGVAFALSGHNGSAYGTTGTPLISLLAAETWTTGANGSLMTFSTTPIGSITRAERFRIGPAGQFGIGGATFGGSGDIFSSGGASAAPTWVTRATLNAALDHGTLAGLADDDHTQYALLAGRSGGQVLKGGTAAADALSLQATAGVGAGSETIKLLFGNNGADEQFRFAIANSQGILRINRVTAGTSPLNVYNISDAANMTNFIGDGANANFAATEFIANANGPTFICTKARGSLASPGQTLSGDNLMAFESRAYDNSPAQTGGMAAFQIVATEDITTTGHGCQFSFSTVANGATAQTARMIIANDGALELTTNAYQRFVERSTTPSNPAQDVQVHCYLKDDKFVFQFNNGGTVRYKYLDLTGTGVTWVHTTTAP